MRRSLAAELAGMLLAAHVPAGCAAAAATASGAPTAPDAPTRAAAATAPGAAGIAPFAAHYSADWKSINVGTSDLELKQDVQSGHYVYTWTIAPRGIFRVLHGTDVTQRSWLIVDGEEVRPERYRAEQGSSSASIDFDWNGGRARGESENQPVDLPLQRGTQDVMSIQVQVMLSLERGSLQKRFLILDRDEIKEFNYTHEGSAGIRTALGFLHTEIVSSQRTGSNRVLRMWFAPSLGYVPVQAERLRDGRIEFAMRIKSLTSSAR